MNKARLVQNQRIVLKDGLFVIEVKVYEVTKSKKFPEGVKVRCVLIDTETLKPRLLLDNHAPFGFHLHTKLPEDSDFRVSLDIDNYEDAIKIFFDEVKKAIL